MKKKAFVYTTFRLEGYHYYPGADKNTSTATGDQYDVSHLALRHMHYFDFKVWVEVTHDNRDIEFIQLRRRIINEYNNSLELDGKSCEMLADDLYTILTKWYPNKDIRIDVSEEGINGAYVEYEVTDDE